MDLNRLLSGFSKTYNSQRALNAYRDWFSLGTDKAFDLALETTLPMATIVLSRFKNICQADREPLCNECALRLHTFLSSRTFDLTKDVDDYSRVLYAICYRIILDRLDKSRFQHFVGDCNGRPPHGRVRSFKDVIMGIYIEEFPALLTRSVLELSRFPEMDRAVIEILSSLWTGVSVDKPGFFRVPGSPDDANNLINYVLMLARIVLYSLRDSDNPLEGAPEDYSAVEEVFYEKQRTATWDSK